MKKENEVLQNKIITLSKEKDDLSSTLLSTQKGFDAYKISCKAKFPIIDENEISILKIKINNLGNVLKKCEFNKAKVEDMFFKKNASKRHIHTTHAHTSKSHTKHVHIPHAHHAHHAFMCGRIFTCIYCGQKVHLAKFYFDRIIASNNHIWA